MNLDAMFMNDEATVKQKLSMPPWIKDSWETNDLSKWSSEYKREKSRKSASEVKNHGQARGAVSPTSSLMNGNKAPAEK